MNSLGDILSEKGKQIMVSESNCVYERQVMGTMKI